MKKRIMSLILAFAMIMTMIPQTAFASSEDGAILVCRNPEWTEDGPVENEEFELYSEPEKCFSGKC